LVQVDLLSSLLSGLVNQASSTLATGVAPRRMGNAHPSIAPYESFRAADRDLVIAVGNDRQFGALAAVLGDPALEDPRFATNPLRVAHRAELRAVIEQGLATAPASDWVSRLSAAGVPAGLVNDVGEAIAFAESLGLAPVVEVDGSRSIANPIRLASDPAAYDSRPPRLGEHAGADWLAASVSPASDPASVTESPLASSTEGTA
ncbi:MAG: CoA transferase, partial [Leifsonia flava]